MRDEDFYGLAAREISERQFSQPLMAKAYALALGDPDKTRALYIGMRADQLKEEAATAAREAQAREKLRSSAEQAAREKAERQRVAAEKARKKEAEAARRRLQELETQRAGDAWQRGETVRGGWATQQTEGSADNGTAKVPVTKTIRAVATDVSGRVERNRASYDHLDPPANAEQTAPRKRRDCIAVSCRASSARRR